MNEHQLAPFGDETWRDLIARMSQGNPEALSVLVELFSLSALARLTITLLDQDQIYGSDLWVLYKNHSNSDAGDLVRLVHSYPLGGLRKLLEETR